MKTAAVIAEYNPFHEGHAYQLKTIRETTGCECLVVILSAMFSQRGLPSLISVEDKTRLALEYGADLVIELPAVYAAQSADAFARNAIAPLARLGVDTLCFGSETNDEAYLESRLDQLDSVPVDPSASMAANTSKYLGDLRPNDILGLQYIRHCKPFGIRPLPLQRVQSYKSATQTRDDFFARKEGQFLEQYFLKEQRWDSYYPYLRLFLQMSAPERLSSFFLVEEGIENRLIKNARRCTTWPEFLEASISKTYTRARIQRTCLMMLLQITKEQMRAFSEFDTVKVLGMNAIGQALLKEVKEQVPLAVRFEDLSPFLQEIEVKSRALYNSVLKTPVPAWRIIVKK